MRIGDLIKLRSHEDLLRYRSDNRDRQIFKKLKMDDVYIVIDKRLVAGIITWYIIPPDGLTLNIPQDITWAFDVIS